MRAPHPPPNLSWKLTRMNLLVSGTALLLACGAFAVYDMLTFRDTTVRNLSIQAQIAGSNSVSALLFDDARTAGDTLASLDASPDILSAHIYTGEGDVFASYWRGEPGSLPPATIPEGSIEAATIGFGGVRLERRILFDGKPIGIIAVQSDLQPFYDRLERYLIIVISVLLVSLLAAFAVSRVAQRSISQPLVELAALARHIAADEPGYTARAAAPAHASPEVASLIESFNEMLASIHARDRSLQQAQALLEQRVRQRTAELDATNKELESFSYSVSHDLRAPLRHIVGFAALLRQHSGPQLDDRGQRHLATIVDAANRMGRLIDDLLAFSRMGRASLSPRMVDLREIVAEARDEIAPDVAGREIEWDIRPLPVVYGDPALLRPVMINLLSNAVKYTGTRPVARIEVGATASDEGQTIYVRDNGVGFDMQYAGKLFGVFQRLHRADEFSGTGIGLANVRRIISRHGGRTWAEGEPDRGATFYILLPYGPRGLEDGHAPDLQAERQASGMP